MAENPPTWLDRSLQSVLSGTHPVQVTAKMAENPPTWLDRSLQSVLSGTHPVQVTAKMAENPPTWLGGVRNVGAPAAIEVVEMTEHATKVVSTGSATVWECGVRCAVCGVRCAVCQKVENL